MLSQLVRNGRYQVVDRKSSLFVSQEASDLRRATTSGPLNISENFYASMHKWGPLLHQIASAAAEQTADHVLIACPIHQTPHVARGLTVLDDETRCWLNNITASI